MKVLISVKSIIIENMNKRIIFFGSGWFVIPVVEKLISHGLDLVITNDKNEDSKLIKFCQDNNIKTVIASTASDLLSYKSLLINHDLAILASYGAFIPDEIIDLFPEGIINIHPSLLPKYKGPSPVQYQLLNGETTVGVTIIKLDDQIDHGPILAQRPYILQGNETSEDLLSILFEIGAELVGDQITKLEREEKLVETPQDHSQENWSYKIEKKDGSIDLDKLNSNPHTLNHMIRAFYPWPGVWFKANLKGQEKIVKLLPENRIQVEGKMPVSYKDFINGFGEEGMLLLQKLNLI